MIFNSDFADIVWSRNPIMGKSTCLLQFMCSVPPALPAQRMVNTNGTTALPEFTSRKFPRHVIVTSSFRL